MDDEEIVSEEKTPTADKRLKVLLASWEKAGRPSMISSSWLRTSWENRFPDRLDLIDKFPDTVDRAFVVRAFKKVENESTAVDAFIASMVWGHGPSGYGAYRTSRILTTNKDAGASLLSAINQAKTDPLAAYASMGYFEQNHMKYLGPAFGTKVLSFAAAPKAPAPILDQVVSRWLFAMTDGSIAFSPSAWRPTEYQRYLTLMDRWSKTLGITVDEVEHLIFSDSAGNLGDVGKRSTAWREAWVPK